MENKIVWIKGYEGVYDIDTCGNIRKHKKSGVIKTLKHTISNGGYSNVALTTGKDKQTKQRVHRLVADVFIPVTDTNETVDHIDENKLNNHVSNLGWCTRVQNIMYYNTNRGRNIGSSSKEAIAERAFRANERKIERSIINEERYKNAIVKAKEIEDLNSNGKYDGYIDTKGAMFDSVERMVELTGKKIKVNQVIYNSCGSAASMIVANELELGHIRSKNTISKELRRFLQGKNNNNNMYGRYAIAKP